MDAEEIDAAPILDVGEIGAKNLPNNTQKE